MRKSFQLIVVLLLISKIMVAQANQDLLLDEVKHFNTNEFNGGSIEHLKTVVHPSGDLIVAGTFYNTADLDPGTGQALYTSFGKRDFFLSRIQSNGNIVFLKVLQSAGDCILGDLMIDMGENLLITGSYVDSLNFSPGNDTALLTNTGIRQAFIARYDDQGSFLFVKQIKSTGFSQANFLAVHPDGTIGFTGTFQGRADLDPGPDSVMYSVGTQYTPMFCIKMDNNGQYLKNVIIFPMSNPVAAPKVAFDTNGEIILAGTFFGNADFDPSLESYILNGSSKGNAFIARYLSDGSLIFALQFSSGINIAAEDLKIDKANNIYLSGIFSGTADFDPGPGVQNKTSSGTYGTNQDIFMVKISPEGYFSFAHVFGKQYKNYGSQLLIKPNNNVVLVAYFLYSADMDPGPGNSNISDSYSMSLIIAEYTPTGNFVKAQRPLLKASEEIYIPAICISPAGDYWISDLNFQNLYLTNADNSFSETIYANRDYYEGFIIRVNSADSIKFIGGLGKMRAITDNSSVAFSRTDSSGNRYISGSFRGRLIPQEQVGSTPLMAYNNNYSGVFNSKYDKYGNILYLTSITGPGVLKIAGFEPDEEGNTYLVGTSKGDIDFDPGPATSYLSPRGNDDISFMAKYDPGGELIFLKKFAASCEIKKVLKKQDGTFDLAGVFSDPVNFNNISGQTISPEKYTYNIFYANVTTTGYSNKFWKIKSNDLQDFGNDPMGNIYITGEMDETIDVSTHSTPFLVSKPAITSSNKVIFLVKYDSMGNVQYGFGSASPNSSSGRVRISANAADGSVIMISNFVGKFDADPGTEVYEVSNPNPPSSTIKAEFIARYDSIGKLVFAYNLLGPGKFGINSPSLQVVSNGNFYLWGIVNGPSDFQFGPTEKIIYRSDSSKNTTFSKCYLAKYNSDGKVIYVKPFGGEPNSVSIYGAWFNKNQIHLSGTLFSYSNLSPAREKWYGLASESTRGFSTAVSEYNVYTSVKDGYWNDADTWEGGIVPIPGQIVTIKHLVELQGNTTVAQLEIMPGANLEIAPGGRLTILR